MLTSPPFPAAMYVSATISCPTNSNGFLLMQLVTVFEMNPSFFFPAQMMLDAGSPAAARYFPTVEFSLIYHAAMGMMLCWLATQFPSVYPIGAALHHQAQSLPIIRQRLSKRIFDSGTFLNILCAMQTSVCRSPRQPRSMPDDVCRQC